MPWTPLPSASSPARGGRTWTVPATLDPWSPTPPLDPGRGDAGTRGHGDLPAAVPPRDIAASAAAMGREHLDLYPLFAHGVAPAPAHRLLLRALQRAAETPGDRLLVIAPPGFAKSTYTSLLLPQWYLGRWPDRAVLAVTSSDAMAGQFHGVVELGLRGNEAHRAVFPDERARPAPERGWSEDGLYLRGVPAAVKDPSYRVTGFATKVIGSRAHLLLLDDPVDQEQSLSQASMRRVRRELDNVLLPRLHPEGSAVAIMTRWAEADTAGTLIDQGWRTVLLPAIGDYPWLGDDERGDPSDPEEPDPGLGSVWPGRWSLAWLQAERKRIGGAQWQTVWMGNPIAVGVGPFRSAEWFRALPAGFDAATRPRLTRCTFIDTAWSEAERADYTCACTVGWDPKDPERRLYVLAWFRQHIDEASLDARLAEHLLVVRPDLVGVEVPAFRQDTTADLVRRISRRLVGRLAAPVVAVPVATDKLTRARLPAARAEAGWLYVDRDHPLWPQAQAELLGFPGARHDDFVDALSGASALALGPQAAPGGALPGQPIKFRMGN